MSYQRCDTLNSGAEKPSNPLGLNLRLACTPRPGGFVAKRETIPPKKPEGEIPIEQIEEAEQDATDPTHEKEIPPEK
jgi:hypothetical protein